MQPDPLKNVVFCDVTPCGSFKNRRIGGTYRLHYQCDKNHGASVASYCYSVSHRCVLQLLVTATQSPFAVCFSC
jgi:hypothetical protein